MIAEALTCFALCVAEPTPYHGLSYDQDMEFAEAAHAHNELIVMRSGVTAADQEWAERYNTLVVRCLVLKSRLPGVREDLCQSQ